MKHKGTGNLSRHVLSVKMSLRKRKVHWRSCQ